MSRKKKKHQRSDPQRKYHYQPSDIVYSSGWCTSDFRSADKQRAIEREDSKEKRALAVYRLLDFIDSEKIVSFSIFMRRVRADFPQLLSIAVEKHYLFRDYIHDSCNYHLHFEEIEKKFVSKQHDLEELYARRYEDFQHDLEEKLSFRESQIADLQLYIQKITRGSAEIAEYQEILSSWDDFIQTMDSKLLSDDDIF